MNTQEAILTSLVLERARNLRATYPEDEIPEDSELIKIAAQEITDHHDFVMGLLKLDQS